MVIDGAQIYSWHTIRITSASRHYFYLETWSAVAHTCMTMLPALISGVRQTLGAGDRVRGAGQGMGIERAIGKGKKARRAAMQMGMGSDRTGACQQSVCLKDAP